jgi:hypothetical protein
MIQDGDWAPGKNNKGIGPEPGDGFLEAFKTLILDHRDWFLHILRRHHSTRRNAGAKLASGADKAARYDFGMEDTTWDREWVSWAETHQSEATISVPRTFLLWTVKRSDRSYASLRNGLRAYSRTGR